MTVFNSTKKRTIIILGQVNVFTMQLDYTTVFRFK